MAKYHSLGKQVLRDREHVADAADATWAQIIVDALNGKRRYIGGYVTAADPYVVGGKPCEEHVVTQTIKMDGCVTFEQAQRRANKTRIPVHTVSRINDEYACSCGKRWPYEDGVSHP